MDKKLDFAITATGIAALALGAHTARADPLANVASYASQAASSIPTPTLIDVGTYKGETVELWNVFTDSNGNPINEVRADSMKRYPQDVVALGNTGDDTYLDVIVTQADGDSYLASLNVSGNTTDVSSIQIPTTHTDGYRSSLNGTVKTHVAYDTETKTSYVVRQDGAKTSTFMIPTKFTADYIDIETANGCEVGVLADGTYDTVKNCDFEDSLKMRRVSENYVVDKTAGTVTTSCKVTKPSLDATYIMERSTDLKIFTPVAGSSQNGTGTNGTFTATAPIGTKEFYRVVETKN